MAGNRESGTEGGNAIDRISGLPRNVTDQILERLPIRDAARTSILSRNWRYVWAEHPSLMLNKQFCKELLQNRSHIQFEIHFANIVIRILLQRLGPVLKFEIDISDTCLERHSDIDTWMLFLSRKGVRELTLHNAPSQPYKIPSYIFSNRDLTNLNLSNCILKVPNTFQGFNKLTKLFLQEITFEKSVWIWITTPVLVYLKLKHCRGICKLDISAPGLEWLTLYDNDVKFSYHVNCPNVKYAYIAMSNGDEHYRDGQISLTELLGSWQRVERLFLGGFSLKYLVAGTVPEKLPTALNCLTLLVHFRINFDLDQIAWILCLLRSSPILREFELWSSKNVRDDVKVETYLEQAIHAEQNMEQLRTVKMKQFKGSRAELLFVKLLLGSSPSLERIFVEEDKTLDLRESLRISKELIEFSRLSPKSKIIFQPDVI